MTSATTAASAKQTAGTTDALLKKYATQLTAALAVVVGVTGVMMFFHLYKGEVEAMHEWLGVGFVAAVALHLARHRKSLPMLLAQHRMRILAGCTALIAAAFIVAAPGQQGNPAKLAIKAVLRAPVSSLAPVLGLSTDEAIARLAAAGARHPTPAQSILTLAQASNTEPFSLLSTLVEQGKDSMRPEKN